LNAKGLLPYSIPQTDEERFENMIDKLPLGEMVDVTLKVDGQSWSAYYKLDTDTFGVLGRRFELKLDTSNNYVDQVVRYDIENKLRNYCKENSVSLCIRGESYGEGIQGLKNNPHSKQEKGLSIFSVYLIDDYRYANKGDRFYFKNVACSMNLPHVDIIEENVPLTMDLLDNYSKELKKVNGNHFEGVVIKHQNGSFKCINKFYDSEK
jgi:RNA ligase (TIGR02306 family)